MEPKPRDSFDRWWWRCKAFFLAGIAVGAVHLAVLGIRPGVAAPLQPWSQVVARGLDAALLIPRIGLVVCWIGLLLNSARLPDSDRRGLFVFTAWYLVLNLAFVLPTSAPTLLYVLVCLANLAFLVLMIWYLAKSAGEEIQKQIDAKLGIKRPKSHDDADLAPVTGEVAKSGA